MLSAVQIYNTPNIQFKSESFIVLANISWTYLLHAYYRSIGEEYRYYKKTENRKRYDKTKWGADKHWELEKCLSFHKSPIDKDTKNNLMFLIGLRHEIEHQMTKKIDDVVSAKFQACCANYYYYLNALFSSIKDLERFQSVSLQFSTLTKPQVEQLRDYSYLPKNISSFIADFDETLTQEEYRNPRFALRLIFTQKTVNHKGQADRVIEFIAPDSPEAEGLAKESFVFRDREPPRFTATEVVQEMQKRGFTKFGIRSHWELWKSLDGKNPNKKFGVEIVKRWLWYENWLSVVEDYCNKNKDLYI